MADSAPVEQHGSETASWVDQPTTLLLDLIDAVRDRFTGRIIILVRFLAYGFLAMTVVATLLALFVMAIVRLVSLLPTPMWLEYLGLGLVFGLMGSLLWARRSS